jgi:hypothetical protein
LWYTYTLTQMLFSLQNKQILPFTETWMNLRDFILGEVKQSQKEQYSIITSICEIFKKLNK